MALFNLLPNSGFDFEHHVLLFGFIVFG